jgi:alkylation response protein AidB-like acyl-CoA dehydrogenase
LAIRVFTSIILAKSGGATVNFELTDEQELVRQTVRDFAENQLGPSVAERDRQHQCALDEMKAFGELGFYGCAIPEEYGGSPLGAVAETIAIEELSRVDAAFAVFFGVNTGVGSQPVLHFGTDEQKQKYLPRVADGSLYTAFALSEPMAGSDAAAIQCTAKKQNGNYVLNGQKAFVSNGEVAGLFIIMAKTDPSAGARGISAFLVERGSPGLKLGRKERKMGMNSSDTCELFLENVEVPKENLLGAEGQGFAIALNALDDSRIGIAAQATGIAQGALEGAVQYASEREQFGKKIGSFDFIYNYIAEMRIRVNAARLLTRWAAWLREEGRAHTAEAAMAKVFASDSARWVTDKAVQIHGGYGYIVDFSAERFFREAKVTQIYEGTNEILRMVVARETLPPEAFK